MNQDLEPHIDKCAAVAASGGSLWGKLTCPEGGTDLKLYTDAECTTRCELADCKTEEDRYTQKWGDCIPGDGYYLTVTGAKMMASGVAASLLAVAAATF